MADYDIVFKAIDNFSERLQRLWDAFKEIEMEREYYLVVYLTKNGDIKIENMTKSQIGGFTKAVHDFAIIAGWLVKDLGEKLDMSQLWPS